MQAKSLLLTALILLFGMDSRLQPDSTKPGAPEEYATDGQVFIPQITFPSAYITPDSSLVYPQVSDSGLDDMAKGFKLYKAGKYRRAAAAFKAAVKKTRCLKNYAVYYEMHAHLKLNRKKQALKCFRVLMESKARPGLFSKGGIELVRGKVPQVLGERIKFARRLESKLKSPELLNLIGNLYYEQENWTLAFEYYIKVLKKYKKTPYADSAYMQYTLLRKIGQPADPSDQLVIAKYLSSRNRSDKARDIAGVMSKKKGRLQKSFLLLTGSIAYRQRKYRKAIEIFRDWERRYGFAPYTTLSLARSYKKLGLYKTSRIAYNKYLARFPRAEAADNILWSQARTREEKRKYKTAINLYNRLNTRYRKRPYATKAHFRMGYCYYKLKNYPAAIRVWSGHEKRYLGSLKTVDCYYWIGKVHEICGRKAQAARWYLKTMRNNLYSFYAFRAGQRIRAMGADSLLGSLRGGDTLGVVQFLTSLANYKKEFSEKINRPDYRAYERGMLLLQCGIFDFAFYELRRVVRATRNDMAFHYYLIKTFETHGFFREAYRLSRRFSWKIMKERYPDMPSALLKILFPRYYGEFIQVECRKYGMDPFFIHAIIRQESIYDYKIVSPAGAVGLMQFMPYTARETAAQLKVDYHVDSLYRPLYSLRLGIYHIITLFDKLDDNKELTLCGYNAGYNAARRWLRKNRGLGYDEFIEEIGYTETRGYVKKCMRNYWTYRNLWADNGT
jgi:soluble lytic murein transglycosylase